MSSASNRDKSVQERTRIFPDIMERSRAKSMGDPDIKSKDTQKPVVIRKLGISLAQKTKSRMQLELLMRDFQKLSIQPTSAKPKPLIVKTNIIRKPMGSSIFHASSHLTTSNAGEKRSLSLEHDGCKICNEIAKEKLTDHAIQRMYLMAHGRTMPKDMISKVHQSFDKALGGNSPNPLFPQVKSGPTINKYYNAKSLNIDQEIERLFKPLDDAQIYDPRITKTEKSSLPSIMDLDSAVKKDSDSKVVSKDTKQKVKPRTTQAETIELPTELAGLGKLKTVDPVEILAAMRNGGQHSFRDMVTSTQTADAQPKSPSIYLSQPHHPKTAVSLAQLDNTDISFVERRTVPSHPSPDSQRTKLSVTAIEPNPIGASNGGSKPANMFELREKTKEILTRAMSKDTYRNTSRLLERVLLPKKDTSGYYLCQLQECFENRFNSKVLKNASRHLSHFVDTLKQLKSLTAEMKQSTEDQLQKLKKTFNLKYSQMVRSAETQVNPPRPKKIPYEMQVLEYFRATKAQEEDGVANPSSSSRAINIETHSKPSGGKSPPNESGSVGPSRVVKFDEKTALPTKQKVAVKDPEEITNWLLLDLDETMIFSTLLHHSATEYSFMLSFHDGSKKKYHVQLRPFVREFLERISEMYHLIVYTASQKSYAEKVVEMLDPNGKFFKALLSSDYCLKSESGTSGEVVLLCNS